MPRARWIWFLAALLLLAACSAPAATPPAQVAPTPAPTATPIAAVASTSAPATQGYPWRLRVERAEHITLERHDPGNGNAWLLVSATVTNTGSKTTSLRETSFFLTAGGQSIAVDKGAINAAESQTKSKGFGATLGASVKPNEAETRILVFKVPASAGQYTLTLREDERSTKEVAAPVAVSAPAAPAAPPTATPIPREAVTVVAVTDGDTIRVRFADGRVEPVRYIGIDTPETKDPRAAVECFGEAAAAKNAELVAGQTAWLERDVSDRDKYERLLRYVWVARPDGTPLHVNEELVRWGFAAASSYPPDVRYQAQFGALERAAREQKLGLWGACKSAHDPLPTSTAAPPTPRPAAVPTTAPVRGGNCDPSYPTICLPPAPPDLDCKDIPQKRFPVRQPDPHRLDSDRDGIGCES